MKITVIYHRKKFMVVVASDDTIQDLKEEISRVYKGIYSSCSSPAPISEIQTHTGCVLFDGYTVSSVLSDNDIIIVTSGTTDSEETPHTMPTSVQSSPVCWPYYGFSPMGTYSPVLAPQMTYNRSPASGMLLPDSVVPSSLLATPTKSLFQSPDTRTVGVQYPSPKGTESDSEFDISICSSALPTPPSSSTAIEKRTQAIETPQVHADTGSNSPVSNASSGRVEKEPHLQQVSVEKEVSVRSASRGGDVTVLPCSGEDLCDSGVRQNESILGKIEIALQDSGGRGTARASPSLSQSAKKKRTTQSLKNNTAGCRGSTVAGSASPKGTPALDGAVGRSRRAASREASLRMQKILRNPSNDNPAPGITKRVRGRSAGSESEGKPEAKRKRQNKKTYQPRRNSRGLFIRKRSSDSSSDCNSLDSESEEDEYVLPSEKTGASTKKVVKRNMSSKPAGHKEAVPTLESSSDWTSSDEEDGSEKLQSSELKSRDKTAKGRGGSQSGMSGIETQSVVDSLVSQRASPPSVSSTSVSLPSQQPPVRARHSSQAGEVTKENAGSPSSLLIRTRKVVPRVTQSEGPNKEGRSHGMKGQEEAPIGEDSPHSEVRENGVPSSGLDQQRSPSSGIPDSSRTVSTVSPEHVVRNTDQETQGGAESSPNPDTSAVESVPKTQEDVALRTRHGVAGGKSASTEAVSDQAPHHAVGESHESQGTNNTRRSPEQSEQFSPGLAVYEEVVSTSASSSVVSAIENSTSVTADSQVSSDVLVADSVAEEEIIMTTQLHEDAVTVIQETQEPSRSASPEIPFLGQVETQQPSSFLSKQKVVEHITMHDLHGTSDQGERGLQNGLSDTLAIPSSVQSRGDTPAMRVASSQDDTQGDKSPSKLKKLKSRNVVADTDPRSSDTAMSTNTTDIVETNVGALKKKRKRSKGQGDQPMNGTAEDSAVNATSASSDASESEQQAKKRKQMKRLSQEEKRAMSSGEDEMAGGVDDLNSEIIPETQTVEPSAELENQDKVHNTSPLSCEMRAEEGTCTSISENHTQLQTGDLRMPEPDRENMDISHAEKEEDLSIPESEMGTMKESQPSKGKLENTTEDDPSSVQSEGVQSDSSCFVVEQPAGAVKQTVKSVSEMKSLKRRRKGKEKKRRKTSENEMIGGVGDVNSGETIHETQTVEPSAGNQGEAHISSSTVHEESVEESTNINESHTQLQSSDQNTLKPVHENSRSEEEEDLSLSESEMGRTNESKPSRKVADTTERDPPNLQSDDVVSDSSCFTVEQPAEARKQTVRSVSETKSRKKGKQRKHRKSLETHQPSEDRPVALATKESATRTEGNSEPLAILSPQKKGLKKHLRHSVTGAGDVSSGETPAVSLKSLKIGEVHSAWSPSLITNTKKSKSKDNPLSVFSLTETERSSEDSSGGEHSAIHARLKKPRKPSLLSALGNHGKASKPSVLKSFKRTPPFPTTQRRFSSEVAMRMFSLTNAPHSAKKAKTHSTPALSKRRHSPTKKKKELSVPIGELSHVDGESSGDVPSISELLADGSLWEN